MKVLLADDDRMSRLVTRHILATEFGCAVAEVCDGLEALEALRTDCFDLLVLDLHMPVVDGRQTLRALRESDDPRWQALPVVVLSADCSEEIVREAAALHIAGYVAKPIVRDRLVDRLRAIVRNLQAAPAVEVP